MPSDYQTPDAQRLAELERRLAMVENELAHLREQLQRTGSAAIPAVVLSQPSLNPTAPRPAIVIHQRSTDHFGTTTPIPPASVTPVACPTDFAGVPGSAVLAPSAALSTTPPTSPPTAPPTVPTAPTIPAHAAPAESASGSLGTQLKALRDARKTIGNAPEANSSMPDAPPVRPKSSTISGLEQALGGRWYALIGAVIVLIGIGLFFKLAVEQGWFTISHTTRCIGVAMAGAAMLSAGEWARRKLTRAASAGFSALGIGLLISSVWAAHRLYDLTGPTLAFVMMAAACALGVAVAARAGLASVAVVALLGAYINPIIAGDTQSSKVGFFAYLVMVLATGLALPLWKGRSFAGVRSLVWWGTVIMGGLAAVSQVRSGDAVSPLVFVTLSWFLIQAELAISAGKFGFVRPPPVDPYAESSPRAAIMERPSSFKIAVATANFWRPMTSSFSISAWSAVLATYALDQIMPAQSWLAPAFFAAFALGGAHVLSGHLRFLTDAPLTDAERVGTSLAVQSGALLIASVSMALGGGTQVVAWLAMGVAAVAAGRWMRARALDTYGLVLVTLGTARLLMFDALRLKGAIASHALGLAWGEWTVFALLAAIAWGVSAWLVRREAGRGWIIVSNLCTGIGLTMAALSPALHAHMSPQTTAMAAILGVAAAAMGARWTSRGLASYALVVLAMGTMKLMMVDSMARPAPEVYSTAMGLSWSEWTAVAAILGMAWVGASMLVRRFEEAHWRGLSNACMAIGLSVAALGPMMLARLCPASVVDIALLGGAMVWVSSRLKSTGLAIYGLAVMAIAMLLPMVAGAATVQTSETSAIAGLVFSGWTIAIVLTAVVWIACRASAPRVLPPKLAGYLCTGGMYLTFTNAFVHVDAEGGSIAIAWLAISLAGASIGERSRWKDLLLPATGVLGLAIVAWLAAYSPLRGGWAAADAPAMLSKGLWTALAIIAGTWWLSAILQRAARAHAQIDARERAAMLASRIPMVVIAVSLLWISTSMEAGRIGEIISSERTVQRSAVSVWWGLFGLGLITAGFMWKTGAGRGVATARRAGLALVAVAVLKALVWDLIQVPPMARVISFVGLGLLMMAVTVIYAKLTGKLVKKPVEGAMKMPVEPDPAEESCASDAVDRPKPAAGSGEQS